MWKRILAVAALVLSAVGGAVATSTSGVDAQAPVAICGFLCGDNHNHVLL
jgi:hypothetical protein